VSEPRFDRARIRAFLALAGARLDGEWLLVGGAAAADWFAPGRTTEDVDLLGLGGTQRERFALMDLAVEAAIPIEAVNSAADFFVRRIADWRDHLVLHHQGPHATIYRPDATLFTLLKLGRLSEVDLADCIALIAHCERSGESIDRARVAAAIDQLPATDDAAARERRARLRALL
jgi:hypothetical protein